MFQIGLFSARKLSNNLEQLKILDIEINKLKSKLLLDVNTVYIFFDYYFNYYNSINNPFGASFIRRNQYELINEIVNQNCEIKNNNKYFHQLIMGAGKSKYITPLLIIFIIISKKYSICIMPETLVSQAFKSVKLLEIFGIKNKLI